MIMRPTATAYISWNYLFLLFILFAAQHNLERAPYRFSFQLLFSRCQELNSLYDINCLSTGIHQ
jgi:hypothetical protein